MFECVVLVEGYKHYLALNRNVAAKQGLTVLECLKFEYLIFKRLIIQNAGDNSELHSSHTLARQIVNWYNHFRKQCGSFFFFF